MCAMPIQRNAWQFVVSTYRIALDRALVENYEMLVCDEKPYNVMQKEM